jgi:hypothetical protein
MGNLIEKNHIIDQTVPAFVGGPSNCWKVRKMNQKFVFFFFFLEEK